MSVAELVAEPDPAGQRGLRDRLDQRFLDDIGWDEESGLLRPRPDHPVLVWAKCLVPDCEVDAATAGTMCHSCRSRARKRGMSPAEFVANPPVKRGTNNRKWLVDEQLCRVPGCQRPQVRRTVGLCGAHQLQVEERYGGTAHRGDVQRFLAEGRPRPFASLGPCRVAACLRMASTRRRLCGPHQERWRKHLRAAGQDDLAGWAAKEPGIAVSGVANLRGLPREVVVELLYGLQLRAERGVRTRCRAVHYLATHARLQQAGRLADVGREGMSGQAAELLRSCRQLIARAGTSIEEEQHKDVWDLSVLGFGGKANFAGIGQSWLRASAKRWAAEDLPKRRGAPRAVIGGYLNALTALSSSLSGRADGGRDPRALHRTDIVGFLTRLAQQESTGQISARVRVRTVRNVRQVLRDARDIGLTREGGPAAGLPGDFAVRADDVLRQPAADPSVRALPAAVMRQLDAGLDELDRRVLVEFRVAVELLMDTGRRPDEICQLPIDCLERDGDGKYVLVYDDFKENRRLRRLPIPDSTAALIRRQQERVRQRFPQTRREQLVLLPTSVRNPHGTRSIRSRVLTNVHREWVNGLPELLLDDGAPYPKHQVVPYAYRHSYAQRHADAGTAVDVLAELLGHELLHSTQRYYNSRELHRTGEKALVAR